MPILTLYAKPGIPAWEANRLLEKSQKIHPTIDSLETEYVYVIDVQGDQPIDDSQRRLLAWILKETTATDGVAEIPFLKKNANAWLLEIGPRLACTTAWSTNATSICRYAGIKQVHRIERFRRLKFYGTDLSKLSEEKRNTILRTLYDRMTECVYDSPITTFELDVQPERAYEVDVLKRGRDALIEVNSHLGLGFDDWDIDYYTKLFQTKIGRNPTSVECFDIAQSNSEHSRHWFFSG
eukprot:gene9992-2167_t